MNEGENGQIVEVQSIRQDCDAFKVTWSEETSEGELVMCSESFASLFEAELYVDRLHCAIAQGTQ